MARSKAYLFRGVQIRWSCTSELADSAGVPAQETLRFAGGLLDYLRTTMGDRPLVGAGGACQLRQTDGQHSHQADQGE